MKKAFYFFAILWLWQSCGGASETPATATKSSEEITPDTPFVLNQIVGIARIEPPEKIIRINAETPGYVREVRFKENQLVQKGDILLVLDGAVEQAQVQQAQSRIQAQKDAIAAAQATLESIQVKLANAANTYERNQRLAKGNAATQQQLDDSRFAVEDLEKQLVAQKATIAQQQSRIKELEADINYYQTLSARRVNRAPLTGTFLSSNIKPGIYVTNETILGDFAMEGAYQAITEVDELFADKVKIGQTAYIRPQGSEEQLATGKVLYVAPYLSQKSLFSDSPDNLEDRRVREVRVQLNTNENVLIGSRVECVIQLEK